VSAPVLVVDARNVLRSRWPNLDETWFLDRVTEWAERESVDAVVVFDGRAPDGTVSEQPVDERTRVVGTGRPSADDWIAEQAPALASGRPLWLVTSDRGLRARVAADRMIGGGAFAGELERLSAAP
jgi:hypothetical protein